MTDVTVTVARRAGRLPEPAPGAGVPARQRRQAARAVRRLPRSPRHGHRHRRARAGLGDAACRGLGPLAGDPPVAWCAGSPPTCTASIPRPRSSRQASSAPGVCRATPYLYSPMPRSARSSAAAADAAAPAAGGHLPDPDQPARDQRASGSGRRSAWMTRTSTPDGELLVVRHAKYGKHRLVPLHPSAVRALARYAGLRRHAHPRPASPALVPVHRRDPAVAQQHRPDLRQAGRAGRAHPALGVLPAQDPRPQAFLRGSYRAGLVPRRRRHPGPDAAAVHLPGPHRPAAHLLVPVRRAGADGAGRTTAGGAPGR